MSTPTIGALFAGYGGLELGLRGVFPHARTAWYSEFDGLPTPKRAHLAGPSAILAHRFPDAPNLGDITQIKWTPDCPGCYAPTIVTRTDDAERTPTGYLCRDCGDRFGLDLRDRQDALDGSEIATVVDIIGGGFPCQDVSHAGKRQGLGKSTRTGLWSRMRDAIDRQRPTLVVAENVRGLLSAQADSDVEPCPWCLGDSEGEPPMRALGAVLADLADIGYHAGWYGLRAADIGAPHGRFRVFIVAWPADAEGDPGWISDRDRLRAGRDALGLAPDAGTGDDGPELSLLPTPVVNDMGAGYTPESWDEWTDRLRESHANGNGHGASLSIEAQRLLKTPTAQLAVNGGSQHPEKRRDGGHGPTLADEVEHLLPTPKTTDAKGASPGDAARNSPGLRAVNHLLPTPRATDGSKGGPNQRGSSGDLMLPSAVTLLPTPVTDPVSGNGHARDLGGEVNLMPTPSVADVEGGRKARSGARAGELLLNGLAAADLFGDYGPAVARWERVTGLHAPAATEPTGKGGALRLSAAFVEWMMGLPAGWVTDPAIWVNLTPAAARNAQLKACGNGVVPQQAAAGISHVLAMRDHVRSDPAWLAIS